MNRPEAPAWAVELLRTARVGRLATSGADAQPLVVPVCYAYDGAHVYSAVDAKPKRTRALRRLRNITDNPRVSLVVDEYAEEWTRLRYVIVEGHADILAGGPEFAQGVDLLVAKYSQYHSLPLARESGSLIRITPDRLLHWRWA